MEGQFQTSFIPKQPIVQKVPGAKPHESSLLMRIALVILVITLLVAGAGFAYSKYLEKAGSDIKSQTDAVVQQLQPNEVTSMSRLDNRIKTASMLLDQHVALSSFFLFLNNTTLNAVRFSSFHYTYTPQKINVVMAGQALNFAAVALQANEFSKPDFSTYISNSIFSGLSLDKSGDVTFNFTADVAPSAFLYANKFKPNVIQAGGAPQTPAAIATTTAATSTSAQATSTPKKKP